MKEFISRLVSLPYRLWKLWEGYYVMCDDCSTIVSGGFGYTDHTGNHKFRCTTCALVEQERLRNKENLTLARLKLKEKV